MILRYCLFLEVRLRGISVSFSLRSATARVSSGLIKEERMMPEQSIAECSIRNAPGSTKIERCPII